MRNPELWILGYLLNSLWQVPLLFAAGWLAARALRSTGAAIEHRVWVIVLLLQSFVPVLSLMPWTWLRGLLLAGGQVPRPGGSSVTIVMGPGTGLGVLQLPGLLLLGITFFYAALCAYFVARFWWRSRALAVLRREAVEMPLAGAAALCWNGCSQKFAIDDASIAASCRVASPLTIGVRQKMVLLPINMVDALPEGDLETVIAHEFAHMQRNDFLKNLLYEWLSLPVAYHPLLWLTRSRIMETREMICDQMAAGIRGPNEYARSLLRLAHLLVQGTPARTPHTIGIFDANMFERRIMSLTENHRKVRGVRRVAGVGACAALGLVICGSAVALAMQVSAPAATDDSSAAKPHKITVSTSVMAERVMTKAVPIYPEAAKKAKIQGAVVLLAVIGKDGNVKSLRALSGPQELQQAALDAVRRWTYKPYVLNGDVVEVQTAVHIIFSLKG